MICMAWIGMQVLTFQNITDTEARPEEPLQKCNINQEK